ncbi:MAG: aldehyde dehydrogenase family protein [Actinomycetota bacterium]|nr:aldehyde dehydrogenase family protein [Actinomycetota bacterium]
MTATRTHPSATELASLIGGEPVRGSSTYPSINPADLEDVVATVSLGDASTVVAACRAAWGAQRRWASIPAPVRGQVIANAAGLFHRNKAALAAIVTREIGKPSKEALGEVQEVIDTCEFFLGEGRRLYGMTVPSEMPDKQLFTYRTPVGVATIITAGNFPVAVPSWYIVPALLCGNAIVWKPAAYASACGQAFAELLWRAGVPRDVLNLLFTDGPSTFEGLEQALTEGLVQKVGFTGSTEVGRRIGELCGRHLQTPCLELGGKNPLVVMPDANIDLAVEGALFSGFGTAGQRCTSLGTAIVHERVHDEFLERFARAVRDAPIGDPTEDVLYGPMLDERFLERFERDHLSLVRAHHSLHGSSATGRITAASQREGFVGDPERGLYVHPTIVSGVRVDDEVANTETFGPLVGVASFADWEEGMALANGHGFGLSSAIYTNDPRNAFRFREQISAGMVSVNNSTSGAEAHLPFGGNGKSGNGARQSGVWVLEQFTRWQSMNWDYAGKLQKAQMDVAEIEADLDYRL